MRNWILGGAASLGMVACNSGGPTYITAGNPNPPSLQVSATGSVSAAPDVATVTAGVVSEGTSAREAMINNATLMTSVYEELATAGIEKSNIQTSQLSLQPRYDYRDRRAPKISGYEARNTVTVKSDNLDKVGPMLDALVKAGINNINGITFSVSNPKEAMSKAREEAIKEAKAKAQAMANAAGVKLGPLLSLDENNFNPQPRPMMMSMRAESDISTPVSAGEQSMSVTVNLSYAIQE
jgi:uncharacterized protein YggE